MGYTRRGQTEQIHIIRVGHQCTQTNICNVNKTCTLLQTTGGKDESNIVFMRNRNRTHNVYNRTTHTHRK